MTLNIKGTLKTWWVVWWGVELRAWDSSKRFSFDWSSAIGGTPGVIIAAAANAADVGVEPAAAIV